MAFIRCCKTRRDDMICRIASSHLESAYVVAAALIDESKETRNSSSPEPDLLWLIAPIWTQLRFSRSCMVRGGGPLFLEERCPVQDDVQRRRSRVGGSGFDG